MQRLEVRGAVRPIYGSLGVKRLINRCKLTVVEKYCTKCVRSHDDTAENFVINTLRTQRTQSETVYAIFFIVRGWQHRRNDVRPLATKWRPQSYVFS